MSMGNSSLNLGQDLPKDINFAIHMICELTGEDPHKIASLHNDEIYSILCFLLKCEKEKLRKLLREHDEHQELDMKTLQMMWKLVQKGVVKARKRGFTGLDEKVDENLRINMGRMVKEAIYRGDNSLGAPTSNMQTSIPPVKQKTAIISFGNLQKFAAMYVQKTAGIDAPGSAIANLF